MKCLIVFIFHNLHNPQTLRKGGAVAEVMSDLMKIPDTRHHWKAKIHKLAYKKGSITIKEAKAFAATLSDCPTAKVPSFLRRGRWFKQIDGGQYEPLHIWHDTRKNESLTRTKRKHDIEYSIVSLLQNAGHLSSREILEQLWLNNCRELPLNIITTCCNLSSHIVGSLAKWSVKA